MNIRRHYIPKWPNHILDMSDIIQFQYPDDMGTDVIERLLDAISSWLRKTYLACYKSLVHFPHGPVV